MDMEMDINTTCHMEGGRQDVRAGNILGKRVAADSLIGRGGNSNELALVPIGTWKQSIIANIVDWFEA